MENILINHSLTLNSDDQMICQYCNNICAKGYFNRQQPLRWWECNTCHVSFLVNAKGDIDTVELKSEEEDEKFYTVNLFLNKNTSSISVWNKVQNTKSQYTVNNIVTINQVIEITPINFQDKLKTYIIFS